ncbi:hypothetical protein BDF21DRAFT_447468 [Thamnidium elegans]|nr:hypothetical protein BDF21DRAFT_447468 [Thamnidium elegans]
MSAQQFIGPLAQNIANNMEDVEYSDSASEVPIQPVVEHPSQGTGSDPVLALKTSLTLAQADVASLSSLVVTFVGSQDQLSKYHYGGTYGNSAQYGNKIAIILVILYHIGSKLSKVVPRELPLFQWLGNVTVPGAHVFVDINTCLMKFTDV